MLIDFRERGREGEREGEKDRCETETSIRCLLYAPLPGTEPPRPGIEPMNFWCAGRCSNQLSHTGHGSAGFFF